MNTLPEAFLESGVRLSLLIFGWAAVVLILLGLGLILLGVFKNWDWSLFLGLGLAAFGILFAVIWVIDMFPYDGQYQHYYSVQGNVEKVSNVLSDADGDFTRQPVVTLDSVERPLVIDDPRAIALLKHDVTLRCVIEWHYQAADTYNCKIVQY